MADFCLTRCVVLSFLARSSACWRRSLMSQLVPHQHSMCEGDLADTPAGHGMNGTKTFPIPFQSRRTMTGGKAGSYVAGAMFTADYVEKAARLAASCEKFGLPYAIHEVPTVHRSISARGTEDLSYTKPNFIRHLMAAHNKPVLYLDADCEFLHEPDLIRELVRSRCDFAIYNGFADAYADRFLPVERWPGAKEPPVPNRYYHFAGNIGFCSERQLFAYGLVQLYRNSLAARALLARWHRTIAAFPDCADDACLNFVFNNLTSRSWLRWLLKVRWLPKSYARISWWIYEKPIINHAARPTSGGGLKSSFIKIKDPRGRQEFYRSLVQPRQASFPQDCVIDTEQHMLCRFVDGELASVEPIKQTFWL